MYHYVREVDADEDPLGYNLSVTPELFEAHLEWLDENNYTPIRMDTLAECLRGLQRCPRNPVVLTFDDGYEDAATVALPVLEDYGFTATFYIVTEFVGKPGYMTWEQVRLLHESGMEIGSHTINHPDLTARSPEEAYQEIAVSQAIITKHLQEPVRSFSYPIGSYTPLVASLVRDAGYTNAVTTFAGSSLEQMYELPRRRVLGGESVEALAWYVTAPAIE
jgi:peptidoglycan/xylan/chitin deacetylase (PgdA/CDA1 family)